MIEVPTLRQRIAESGAELEQAVRRILLTGRYAGDAEVAKRVGLDPRTTRKYVQAGTVRA